MSLQPEAIAEIPQATIRVAKAAFPNGNLYMQMRDQLGTIYQDIDFKNLFPASRSTSRKSLAAGSRARLSVR